MKNIALAMPAAAPAIPENPRTAEIKATIKKNATQLNITTSGSSV